jgi:hypothetical protein
VRAQPWPTARAAVLGVVLGHTAAYAVTYADPRRPHEFCTPEEGAEHAAVNVLSIAPPGAPEQGAL